MAGLRSKVLGERIKRLPVIRRSSGHVTGPCTLPRTHYEAAAPQIFHQADTEGNEVGPLVCAGEDIS